MKIKEINDLFRQGIIPSIFLFDPVDPLPSQVETVVEQEKSPSIIDDRQRDNNTNE